MSRIQKYYAVLSGREGPKIYDNVREYKQATNYYGSSCSKSFFTYAEAAEWLAEKGVQIDRFRGRRPFISAVRNSQLRQGLSTTSPPFAGGDRSTSGTTLSLHCHNESSTPVSAAPVKRNDSLMQVDTPIPPKPETSKIELSPEQQEVLDLIISGKSVFFTGPAGTGKSVLLGEAIRVLRERDISVAVTAPTGIAGVNIGGSTIHSFAGIGLGKEEAHVLAENIVNSSRKRMKWESTQVLIIDEVSMLDGRLFDKLEYIAREARECPLPFGGMQLVLSGDFFQLPPVREESNEHRMEVTFAFEAMSWRQCVDRVVILKQVFRQKDDNFVRILTAMRSGVLAQDHIRHLRALQRPLFYEDGIEPCYLFPTRMEVEACNNNRLGALPGSTTDFLSFDSIGYDYKCNPIPERTAFKLFEQLNAPHKLSLKPGAQVMLLQNVVQGSLVNGSRGKVVDFLTTHEAMEHQIQIAQPQPKAIPERYASAPMTDISRKTFSKQERFPLVQFPSGVELLCAPLEFTVQGFMGNVEVRRYQIPLMLSWAMSIHKSQGQTIERVKIDLRHIFENGQAYVAISRARNLQNLELVGFHPGKVMAHPRVIAWQEESSKSNLFEEQMDCEEAVASFWRAVESETSVDLRYYCECEASCKKARESRDLHQKDYGYEDQL